MNASLIMTSGAVGQQGADLVTPKNIINGIPQF
jgi:hypothetical protein